jgi:hypothetical protein
MATVNVSCPHCGQSITVELDLKKSGCYVVTAIYGFRSTEVRRAMAVCRWRFVLNPLVTPSWLLYKIVGPALARAAQHSPRASKYLDLFVARPIILASAKNLSGAVLPLIYLGFWGWAVTAAVVYLVARSFVG